jgi:hypothetical protein
MRLMPIGRAVEPDPGDGGVDPFAALGLERLGQLADGGGFPARRPPVEHLRLLAGRGCGGGADRREGGRAEHGGQDRLHGVASSSGTLPVPFRG